MKSSYYCFFFLFSASCFAEKLSDDPYLLVNTENGPVRGAWNLALYDEVKRFFGADPTIHSRYFASIPFAEPPVGPLRFSSPERYKHNWGSVDGNGNIVGTVRKAADFPPACPQNFFAAFTQSEDCLFLNVFTPSPRRVGGKKLPVMVYIFGGAFHLGDSYTLGMYNARQLTDTKDIIVVTLNHRLDALGFFVSEDSRGNYGIEDQREALRWVKRNIANFGGDPDNVTLFGISSGAISGAIHATSPGTEAGLIHKVIHQSGPLGAVIRSKEAITKSSFEFAQKLNCIKDKKPDMNCLRRASYKDILKASGASAYDPKKDPTSESLDEPENRASEYIGDTFIWWPSVDGYNIVEHPLTLIKQGKHADIPIIFGVQKDEGALWYLLYDVPIYGDIRKKKSYNAQSFETRLKEVFGVDFKMISNYYPIQEDPEANVRTFINLLTDYAFLCPTEDAAFAWSKNTKNVFMYRWTQASFPPLPRCRDMCCHSNEVPYFFSTLWPMIDEERVRLRSYVQTYWANFAATGNPSIKANGSVDQSVPTWPAYTPGGRIRQELGDRVGPEDMKRALFCEVMAKIDAKALLPSPSLTRWTQDAARPSIEQIKEAFENKRDMIEL